ncbi:hypothetical protein GCM10010412_088670 [Nonomuraea recticatena]|uniref:Uncharacterized protein n=1 Tax=Nonomuraea recticatena TaxID=46178 RepID=A0ABP6FPN9_9ACTN
MEERRQQHRNSRQPWTDEDDQRLKELAAAPGASITRLMEHFGRSRASIEARLPRVGVEAALPYRARSRRAGRPRGTRGDGGADRTSPRRVAVQLCHRLAGRRIGKGVIPDRT